PVSGGLGDVRGLEPRRALRDLERYPLPLVQRAEPAAGDRGVVNEDVLPLVRGDEAVSLLTVEPLHLARSHCLSLLAELTRILRKRPSCLHLNDQRARGRYHSGSPPGNSAPRSLAPRLRLAKTRTLP